MRLIRLKEVIYRTGLSRSSIYKLMGEGKFPVNVPLGERATCWVDSEISSWIELVAGQAAKVEGK
ncbi:AlpA family transcriptional regulator [Vibrio vulnificus]|uniref:AlpA family transcriptional regulator n=1 Tax=Vibrio vulnificus TaxID=672 RepID=UPI0019D49AA3|nr:AlpA family transcriptional regulator [Vibrio vulnificus]MBN8108851.1 AlpA family transcriptional regulator [Vibrio vulnificus]